MKHKILIALTLIVFSSCMKLKKKGEDQDDSQVTAKSQTVENLDLTYDYVPSADSSLTRVRFTLPQGWDNDIVVKKTVNGTTTESLIRTNLTSTWDDVLTTDHVANYKFYRKVGTDMILLDQVDVLPALDLSLTEDLNLVKFYKITSKTQKIYFKRLELEANTHLYFEDFTGPVLIENLKSNSGYLQTFEAGDRAAEGMPGKSGGTINFRIISAQGNLNILMKGQNGGNGLPALPPDAKLKGGKGTRGVHALFSRIEISLDWGPVVTYSCKTAPGNGHQGGKGLQGYPGQEGKDGGNSGSALVENFSPNLNISVSSASGGKGFGSPGGAGGDPGEGGDGGDGAAQDLELFLKESGFKINPVLETYANSARATLADKCPAAASGPVGEYGELGNHGNDATDGVELKSCVTNPNQIQKCINE